MIGTYNLLLNVYDIEQVQAVIRIILEDKDTSKNAKVKECSKVIRQYLKNQ